MGYNRTKLENSALEVIRKNELVFIRDIMCFLPCTRSTFYLHNLHKSDTIQKELLRNKSQIKARFRKRWEQSKNQKLQLALYRLLANGDELRRLSTKSRRQLLHNVKWVKPIDQNKKETSTPSNQSSPTTAHPITANQTTILRNGANQAIIFFRVSLGYLFLCLILQQIDVVFLCYITDI